MSPHVACRWPQTAAFERKFIMFCGQPITIAGMLPGLRYRHVFGFDRWTELADVQKNIFGGNCWQMTSLWWEN